MAELNSNPTTEIQRYGNFKSNITRFLLNYGTRIGTAGVVLFSSVIGFQNYSWFTWHIVLCTCGYIPLMAESFMLFLGDELWTRQMTRTEKYTIHGIIISFATILIIIGDVLVFCNFEAVAMRSVHSITGTISLIFLIISLPFGLVIKYNRELHPFVPFRLILIKTLHNFFGVLGYVIGIISLCYGFYTHWFVYYTTYRARIWALFVTIFVGCWTLNGALVSLVQQIKSVF